MAGLSAHYYARLERGADRHPSAEVVDALARALGLDPQAHAHLRGLAETAAGRPPGDQRAAERLAPEVRRLFAAWRSQPAIVIGRYRDVLAATEVAPLVNPGFVVGTNLLEWAFITEGGRDVYLEWEVAAGDGVAGMRASAGIDPTDPRLNELLDRLSKSSEDFRRMWALHDAREPTEGTKRYLTELAGPIALDYVTFTVNAAPDQTLYAFFARPGSRDERALAHLADVAAGLRPPEQLEAETARTGRG